VAALPGVVAYSVGLAAESSSFVWFPTLKFSGTDGPSMDRSGGINPSGSFGSGIYELTFVDLPGESCASSTGSALSSCWVPL
jgi:hypothetical protein